MYSSNQFYNEFAGSYKDYSKTKFAYLCSVNEFVKNESTHGGSLLDIGAGDGKRSIIIAEYIRAKKLTIVDNSSGMISLIPKKADITILERDVSDGNFFINGKYGVVLCLWNVLGHVPTEEKRLMFLSNVAKCVQDDGFVFLDVNNRYNISHYGFFSVIKNIFKDLFKIKERGDYILSLDIDNSKISTLVHIFNPFEIEKLIRSSGLKIIKREIINYRTGKKMRWIWSGQILYKLSNK